MPPPRRQSAALLFALLMAGGVLSPVVHQLQHAHHAEPIEALPPGCDHAGHPVAFESTEARYDGAVCALCAFTLSLALPAPAEVVVLAAMVLPEPDVRSRLVPGAPLHLSNRGPPRSA